MFAFYFSVFMLTWNLMSGKSKNTYIIIGIFKVFLVPAVTVRVSMYCIHNNLLLSYYNK